MALGGEHRFKASTKRIKQEPDADVPPAASSPSIINREPGEARSHEYWGDDVALSIPCGCVRNPGLSRKMNLMNPTFVFWDTETTRLDRAFHGPVDYAGVVTDTSLRPIHNIDISCRPPRFVLPEPGASD